MLTKQSQQQQLIALTVQVAQLKEVNETLKKYLEAVMTGTSPDASAKLIQSEEKRLEDSERKLELKKNPLVQYLIKAFDFQLDELGKSISEAKTFNDFISSISSSKNLSISTKKHIIDLFIEHNEARKDLNRARQIFDLSPLYEECDESMQVEPTEGSSRKRRKLPPKGA